MVFASSWRAYFAGMQFHQNEVRDDPNLLEWVLRPNYFDYRLPEGWERYSQQAKGRSTRLALTRDQAEQADKHATT